MSVASVLNQLRLNRSFMSQVVAWERLPAKPARFASVAAPLPPALTAALEGRGVGRLFRHQAQAIDAALAGQNVIVATATASGKSLCYTVPVFQRLLTRPAARALYLFPTKALAHDQLAESQALIDNGDLPLQIHAYDGDTPRHQRSQIRRAGGVLITNPDMLHSGVLPYHTSWRDWFANLEIVVIDEVHAYRGVFGSHVANLLRRLRRICRFYGRDPQFICCSATIANPQEHVEKLVEAPFTLIDEAQNGAPAGAKQFILYNPPLIDETLGLRQSVIFAAREAAEAFLRQDVATLIFARTRQTVELLLAYLREGAAGQDGASRLAGYRGGYLPLERREIERGLRSGVLRGVVATNALELGIDVGELDAVILTGYPGSIASTWQQAGRAGRRSDQSAVILIASGNPLDQYICRHPRFLFGRSPEHALINPDNLRLLVKHLACAAYELPFEEGEAFGRSGAVDELLALLAGEGALHQTGRQYHWLGEGPPAHSVSLRVSGDDRVVIQEMAGNGARVIGEVDLESAPLLAHEGAVYMHQARAYLVETLDWEGRIAYTRPVEVDYYTRASLHSSIRRLDPVESVERGGLLRAHGDLNVVAQAVGYRKIKRYTHETLAFGEIDLPALELETAGYWLIFSEALTERLMAAGIFLPPNDYGPVWERQRRLALERDGHRCQTCGAAPAPNRPLHVHHIRPFREYGYIAGQNENDRLANHLDNLATLCAACHRRAEAGQRARSALGGLAYLLGNLAPLFLMCDPGDIQVSAEGRSPVTRLPTVVIYERIPAGVGFSQRLFELHDQLLASALELVAGCRCRDGCPACVGPPGEIGPDAKAITRQLLSICANMEECNGISHPVS